MYFNFSQKYPRTPPSPYLVWIQDSEFSQNFGQHPLVYVRPPVKATRSKVGVTKVKVKGKSDLGHNSMCKYTVRNVKVRIIRFSVFTISTSIQLWKAAFWGSPNRIIVWLCVLFVFSTGIKKLFCTSRHLAFVSIVTIIITSIKNKCKSRLW